MVLKAFCKSTRILPVTRPGSNPVNVLSNIYEREVSVECFLQNPVGICEECSFPVGYLKFGCATFSLIFKTIW